jgi:hypothetical protein
MNRTRGLSLLRLSRAVTLLAGFSLSPGIAPAADAATERVTFHRDVLPILEKHCQGCHRPGQIAPMSFLTYATTRPWAAQIRVVVVKKKMPPAVTNPHYALLTAGDGLSPSEIDTIVKWLDGGAAEGTPPRPERKRKK